MKKIVFTKFLILAIICVTIFLACNREGEEVTGITLNKDELVLLRGDTETLIATVYPENATNKNVRWKSSKPLVVKVNDNGKVTALAKGNATITVTTKDGNKKATCSIVVVTDYRAQWTGDWDFEVERNWWNYLTGVSGHDTIYYLGKISLGDAANELYIKYYNGGDGTMLLQVDKAGELSGFQTGSGGSSGSFEGDNNVYIYLRWGGQGGGAIYKIKGIKRGGGKSE